MNNPRRLTGILLVLIMLMGAVGTSTTTQPAAARIDPVDLVTAGSILTFLDGLTSIQPYSGWRNSGSGGELDAVNYVADTLSQMSRLTSAGLTVEQQDFNVLTGVVHQNIDGSKFGHYLFDHSFHIGSTGDVSLDS